MNTINILLIEDDEDDYVIIRDLLSKNADTRHTLQWVTSVDDAREMAFRKNFDVCLLDYRLGMKDGLALLEDLKRDHFNAPVIMMTGQGSRDLDIDAMRLGADDYIEKGMLTSDLLERSIRYSLDRWQTLQQLRASEQKLRRLSAKILNAQEDERKHIAKELHDSIGANLTAIKLMLEINKPALESNAAAGESPMDKILSLTMETIEETKRITKNLRPQSLDKLGLVTALQSIIRKFSEIAGNVSVETDIDVAEESVPEELKITIYRIVQEAFNNITKHSSADHVAFQFKQNDGNLELAVWDNGKGFDRGADAQHAGDSGGGMGLTGIQERAELANGDFELASTEGEGTILRVVWKKN